MKERSQRGAKRSLRSILYVAAALGLFVATPSMAYASTTGGASVASGATIHDIGWWGGGDHGGHHGGGDGGDGGSDGGGGTNIPEVPYAAVLPVGLIGLTLFVYRRRTRTQ